MKSRIVLSANNGIQSTVYWSKLKIVLYTLSVLACPTKLTGLNRTVSTFAPGSSKFTRLKWTKMAWHGPAPFRICPPVLDENRVPNKKFRKKTKKCLFNEKMLVQWKNGCSMKKCLFNEKIKIRILKMIENSNFHFIPFHGQFIKSYDSIIIDLFF